jgi:hypothetical protein
VRSCARRCHSLPVAVRVSGAVPHICICRYVCVCRYVCISTHVDTRICVCTYIYLGVGRVPEAVPHPIRVRGVRARASPTAHLIPSRTAIRITAAGDALPQSGAIRAAFMGLVTRGACAACSGCMHAVCDERVARIAQHAQPAACTVLRAAHSRAQHASRSAAAAAHAASINSTRRGLAAVRSMECLRAGGRAGVCTGTPRPRGTSR